MADPQLGTGVTLKCVKTGCTLLSGQAGMAVNIDTKTFHDALYLAFLDAAGDNENVATALVCIRLLLHERREVSLDRVAAFVRRLATASLKLEPHQAVAALFNVRCLMMKYPKLTGLLDSDMLSTNVHRPELAEPEHSCPFATPMWELSLLGSHFFPWVTTHSKHVAFGSPSAGPGSLPQAHARALPHELFESFDPSRHGFSFNPAMKLPKPHPLSKNKGKRAISHIPDRPIRDPDLAAALAPPCALPVSAAPHLR